ncbi:MAG: RNA-binding S4 domain-containing protein [Actinomycetes bacterium]
MSATAGTSARLDAWIWAVRLFPTRSAATAAVKAGHVKVNAASAKPAQSVKVGDTIRIRDTQGERIVKVLGLLDKRVGAPVAVTMYDDLTPPAPPKEERVVTGTRDRGAGRPTKRDRRQVERLMGRE